MDTCAYCGGSLDGQLHTSEMMFGLGHPFTYGTCTVCGSLTNIDAPTDMSPYYPSTYYSYQGQPIRASRVRRQVGRFRARAYQEGHASRLSNLAVKVLGRPAWRDRIFFAAPTSDAAILDVGCGAGELLEDLWRDGYQNLMGIDPFLDQDLARSRSRPGLELRRAPLGELSDSFDLIMFNHSLEHVPDPFAELALARRLLGAGGQILVRLPVADSDNFERYGPHWFALDPPRHLTIPTRHGLRLLAERSGLRVVAESDDSGGDQEARSILYSRGMPSVAPDGSDVQLEEHFSRAELAEFDERARAANSGRRGDTSRFVLVADHEP